MNKTDTYIVLGGAGVLLVYWLMKKQPTAASTSTNSSVPYGPANQIPGTSASLAPLGDAANDILPEADSSYYYGGGY